MDNIEEVKKICQMTLESDFIAGRYDSVKCNRLAKFINPKPTMGIKYVCGVHARSLDAMYKRTGQTERCQLLPQPLDDKDLRKEIRKIIEGAKPSYPHTSPFSKEYYEIVANQAKQISLALLQPKIEEARRQGEVDCVAELLEAGIQVSGIKDIITVLKATENYAKREERERIITRVESVLGIKNDFGNVHMEYCSWEDWQALKGGE